MNQNNCKNSANLRKIQYTVFWRQGYQKVLGEHNGLYISEGLWSILTGNKGKVRLNAIVLATFCFLRIHIYRCCSRDQTSQPIQNVV
jgi:hypothetical protein